MLELENQKISTETINTTTLKHGSGGYRPGSGRKKIPNTVGGQFKFKDPTVIWSRFLKFQEDCKERKVPLTLSRFASVLDTTRTTLASYEYKDLFTKTIKKVKTLIEADLEERLLVERNPIGYHRALCNGFEGWNPQEDIGKGGNVILKIEFTRKKKDDEAINVTPKKIV
ncbi:MAG: hypothetical protein FP829_01325 [Nitrospirae bacterium]|nr:hypothetical protein [Nitrospirota bacterium]